MFKRPVTKVWKNVKKALCDNLDAIMVEKSCVEGMRKRKKNYT